MSDVGYSPNNQYDIDILILRDRNGNEYDIKNMLVELNVFSSIFQPIMTGNVVLYDPSNTRANLAIMGGESLVLRYKNAGMTNFNHLEMVVKSQGEIVQEENNSYVRYQLLSPEGLTDSCKRVSLPYQGSYYVAVSKLFDQLETNKNIEMHQTKSNIGKGVTPYSSPLSSIDWFTSRAMDDQNSPFVFFENEDGFHFKSMGRLLGQESKAKFVKDPVGMNAPAERDIFNIRELEFRENNFNILGMTKRGLENRAEFHFDIFEKRVTRIDRNYETEFEFSPSLDPYPLPTSGQQHNFPVWVHTLGDSSDDMAYQRELYINSLNSFGIKVITVATDPLRVGNVYEYNPLSHEPADGGRKKNEKYTSGRYLLVSLRRTFTTTEYYVTSELAKDSLSEELNNG